MRVALDELAQMVFRLLLKRQMLRLLLVLLPPPRPRRPRSVEPAVLHGGGRLVGFGLGEPFLEAQGEHARLGGLIVFEPKRGAALALRGQRFCLSVRSYCFLTGTMQSKRTCALGRIRIALCPRKGAR